MLKINSLTYKIDERFYEDAIQKDGFDMYIDKAEYYSSLVEAQATLTSLDDALRSYIFYITDGKFCSIDKSSLTFILKDIFAVDSMGLLIKTSNGGISLDMQKVFKPLKDFAFNNLKRAPAFYGIVYRFCSLYIEYSETKSLVNTVTSKLAKGMLRPVKEVNNNGGALMAISSHYEKQSTGRYYTNGDNLQGWNKKILTTFVAPKDYFLVWADFDQIDFRVASNMVLLRGLDENAVGIFNSIDDKYEAMARIVDSKLGREFSIDRFKRNRKAYKTSVLARLYGASVYTMMRNGFNDSEEINKLNEFYNTHGYYRLYEQRFKDAIKYNADVQVTDYFGNTRIMAVPPKGQKDNRILEQSLNLPIQSTSNDIVMIWVNELVKDFRKRGFGPDKFRVALIRHDEGLFLMHKDCIELLWLFKRYSEISIDDWTPLTISPEIGYNYGLVNEDLMNLYKKQCAEHINEMYVGEDNGLRRSNDWLPCKKTAYAVFFYPSFPAMFAYGVLVLDKNWESEAIDLFSIIGNKGAGSKEALVKAKELITAYKQYAEQNGIKNICMEMIESYNRFFNYGVLYDGNQAIPVKNNEFIKLLKEHDIGYVTVYTSMLQRYFIKDGIQFRYSTDWNLSYVTSELEKYIEVMRSD